MTSVRVRLSGAFGRFWLRRQDGWYGRFVESRAYAPTILFVALSGFALVLVILSLAVIAYSAAWLVWSLVAVAAYLLLLMFLTSFGVTAAHSAKHAETPAELHARCRRLLLQHDFEIRHETPGSLLAARGIEAGAESEWRNFPLEITATVDPSEGGATLSVRCTGESAAHRFVRRLILKTCEATANLDDKALQALDKALVMRRGGLFQGGLASHVFAALLICTVLSAVLVAGVSYGLATFVLDATVASAATEDARRLQFQLASEIDRPLRSDVGRLARALEKTAPRSVAPREVLRDLESSSVPGELVVAVMQPAGGIALIHPSGSGPLAARLTPQVVKEMPHRLLYRVGDRILHALPHTSTRDLETRLGLKAGELVIGMALSHDDLARLAPRSIAIGPMEITFFDTGRPILRYTWRPGKEPKVDGGSGILPRDVIASAAKSKEDDWTAIFKNVLFGGSFEGTTVRIETRDHVPYRVVYSVSQRGSAATGWDGISIVREYDQKFETRDWIPSLAISLALLAMLPVLILAIALAKLVSDRVSRPVLQIRDALRSIAEGEYAVRVDTSRSDEIGKLQKLVKRTAKALRKRESGRS